MRFITFATNIIIYAFISGSQTEERKIKLFIHGTFVIYSTFPYSISLFICRMTLNHIKPEHMLTFIKFLTNVVSLICLCKIFIWNKISYQASYLLNLPELLVVKEGYLPKYLQALVFLFNLSLLHVTILGAYNYGTITNIFISIF